jgi:hypothetical protein
LIKGEDKGLGEEKEKMILVASQDKVGGLKIGRNLKINPFTNPSPPPKKKKKKPFFTFKKLLGCILT